MRDEIRRRLRRALTAKGISMRHASLYMAGQGDTYLFDALVGKEGKDGVRRLGGKLEIFEIVAEKIGLRREWLLHERGEMWESGASPPAEPAPDPDDAAIILEEVLARLLRIRPEQTEASARSLLAIPRRQPPDAPPEGREERIRIAARAMLDLLQDE